MTDNRNVYQQIEDYLANKLGRQPTDLELDAFLEYLNNGGKRK